MNDEITAVTFGLYATENLTAADGKIIPANGLIEIVSINEEGRGIVSTDLPMGSYYLKEQATDSHYVLCLVARIVSQKGFWHIFNGYWRSAKPLAFLLNLFQKFLQP